MLNVNKLYELMDEMEIKSISELAKRTGIPNSTIRYMISGHDMHVGTLIELSRFFNVPMDYLVNKSFGITTLKGNKMTRDNTSSLLEVIALKYGVEIKYL